MIASRVLVDGRRAAKLAPNDNGHILIQTAPVQVFDQRADALVEQREVGFCVLVIVAVIIPETERDGHDTRASFNEAARDEKLFHQHRRGVAVGFGIAFAITLNHAFVFALVIERFEQFA